MGQLELTFTEKFDPDYAESVTDELGAHLDIDGPHFFVRKSVDPGLVQYIQLIGDVISWFPLKAAATVFFGQTWRSSRRRHMGRCRFVVQK